MLVPGNRVPWWPRHDWDAWLQRNPTVEATGREFDVKLDVTPETNDTSSSEVARVRRDPRAISDGAMALVRSVPLECVARVYARCFCDRTLASFRNLPIYLPTYLPSPTLSSCAVKR